MVRSNADERRAQVVEAAIALFAHTGYEGTKTSAIAARVGVSQPYLFQLFPTKKAMFVAAWEEACARILRTLTDSVQDVPPERRLKALAAAYDELITTDRNLLTLQIHAWSASPADDDIARATRAGVEGLKQAAVEHLGLTGDQANRLLAEMSFYTISIGIGMRDPCTVTQQLELRP